MTAEAEQVWGEFARRYPGSEWNAYADEAFTRAS